MQSEHVASEMSRLSESLPRRLLQAQVIRFIPAVVGSSGQVSLYSCIHQSAFFGVTPARN